MFFLVSATLLIIVLLILLSCLWPPDSPWSPWWKIDEKGSLAAIQLAKVTKNDSVYELGAGDAHFLKTVYDRTGAKCTGIEIDPFRVLITKLQILAKNRKITIKRKNFFDENVTNASVVFVYLVPKALGRLAPKLGKELSRSARIISYRYKFPKNEYLKLVREDKKRNLFLYAITEKSP